MKKIDPFKTAWTVRELLETEFEEPDFIIPDLVTVGLTFLAGRPKIGKSHFALQKAQEAAKEGGKVIYYALEDTPRRIKNRLLKQKVRPDVCIEFVFEFKIPEFDQKIWESENLKLVIIDSFDRIIPKKVDRNDMAQMSKILERLQKTAFDKGISILLVDHLRKPQKFSSSDPVSEVLGSTAKTAVADTILVLTRSHGTRRFKLFITGRDVEEREFSCYFDRNTHLWTLKEVDETSLTVSEQNILKVIDGRVTIRQVAQILGRHPENVRKDMNNLVFKGFLETSYRTNSNKPFLYRRITTDTTEGTDTTDTFSGRSVVGGTEGNIQYPNEFKRLDKKVSTLSAPSSKSEENDLKEVVI